MNTCTKVRALRSCSSDVHVARVGFTCCSCLSAHVVVVVFVVAFP